MPKTTKSRKTTPKVDISKRIQQIQEQTQKLELERTLILEKALKSNDPDTLLKANLLFNQHYGQQQNSNGYAERKSILIDPFSMYDMLGYKDKPLALSYQTLRNMGKAPIIKSIISTRIEQVASFSEYQDDMQKIGWTIRKKGTKGGQNLDEDKQVIEYLINFISKGGVIGDNWSSDNFDDFLRKTVPDALLLDQFTFEIVRNRLNQPVEFFATDGATYRFAEFRNPTNTIVYSKEDIQYYPKYVQLIEAQVNAEFYPWELCFGVRNPSTDIRNFGYGRSELEDMIKLVTWMLYGDQYNGRFFSQGAAPKGIIRLQGNVNDARLAEFKQQWQAQIAGVQNAWKTPILEADKMDFINLQMSNQDMQFSKWQEYLVKLSCALYKIDPSEIGFPMSGSSNSGMFEQDRKYKLEYSQEKGLYPLLKFIQRKLNKYIISQLNPEYEFVFTGIDNEDEAKVLEADIKKLGNFMGYKEIRKKWGLPEELTDKNDMIFNGVYYQMKMAEKQQGGGGMGGMFGGGQPSGEENKQEEFSFDETTNPFTLEQNRSASNPFWWMDDDEEEKQNPFRVGKNKEEENPFVKGLNEYIDHLIEEDK